MLIYGTKAGSTYIFYDREVKLQKPTENSETRTKVTNKCRLKEKGLSQYVQHKGAKVVDLKTELRNAFITFFFYLISLSSIPY